MSLNKIADEFNRVYGIEIKKADHDLVSMVGLIEDEVVELGNEIYIEHTITPKSNPSIPHVIKEAIDCIYISMQQLRERGVDVDAALAEVHRSNMSKSIDIFEPDVAVNELLTAKKRYPSAELIPHESRFVIKCQKTGKIIKPATYSPAVITDKFYK